MNQRLQICLIIGIMVFAIALFYFLVKRKLNLKYTLVWLATFVVLLLAALFPGIISKIAHMFGINTPSNFIFAVYGFFVLLIIFTLTGIVSHMNARIFRLVQTQAIMEKRIRDLEMEFLKGKQEKTDEQGL